MNNKKFELKRTLLIVSFICNNKCKLCGVLSPYYKKPLNFTLKELQGVIDAYFSVVDFVEKFTLSGGEPFLHQEIAEIVGYLKKYENQFGRLEIITNGKLLMTEELKKQLSAMKKSQILIDDYGINTQECQKLLKQAKSNEISVNYRVYFGEDMHMKGWFDTGKFEFRGRSYQEDEQIYKNCGMGNENHFGLFIVGGEGHVCFRSWRLMNLGLVDKTLYRDQYIDFMSGETQLQKRNKILAMVNREKAYRACSFCSGQGENSPRFPAGEQIE